MNSRCTSPVLVASGPWSAGEGPVRAFAAAGAVVTKTVTADARLGNPPPTWHRLADGLGFLNRVGLRNRGAREFAAQNLPHLIAAGSKVMISIYATTIEELDLILDHLEPHSHHGYEFNASCPNIDGDPLSIADLTTLLRHLRQRTQRLIWVKLAYEALRPLRERADACAAAGADALVACNTLPALDLPTAADQPFFGGLSGPALRPLALFTVAQLVSLKRLPIIGVGGVRSLSDVLAFAALGATAVQVGSALLDDEIRARLIDELVAGAAQKGYGECPLI